MPLIAVGRIFCVAVVRIFGVSAAVDRIFGVEPAAVDRIFGVKPLPWIESYMCDLTQIEFTQRVHTTRRELDLPA